MNRLFYQALFLSISCLASTVTMAMGSPPPGGGGGNGGGSSGSETTRWEKLVRNFGGKVVNPAGYSNSSSGFRDFMLDSGVTDYSPLQIITPNSSSAARSCGVTYLLPEKTSWVRGAALVLWAQKIADVAGSKPFIRNWYRPSCYNSKVGGASSSDHITARAIDMDFTSSSARRRAQSWLCSYWKSLSNMQVGLGGNSIHLGVESPYGKRNWYYDSYGDSDKGRTCFDN